MAGLVLLVVYRPDTGIEYREPDLGGALITVAVTLPLLVRRTAPVLAALAIVAIDLISLGSGWLYSLPTEAAVVLVLVYSLGAYARFWAGLATCGALLATTFGYLIVTMVRFPSADQATAEGMVFVTMGFVGLWAIGRATRARRRYTAQLEERAEHLERTRESEVRAARAEERGRIARELHDVVAHHVSVMTVQAAGARRTLERDPGRSREAMEAIESTGRVALAEMRRIVDVLRGPDSPAPASLSGHETTGRSPQPGLADLPDLVEHMRSVGLPVEVQVGGEPRELPLGVELTAYRVIQEALTNTLKHAGARRADVAVRYSPADVTVHITDDGRGPAGEAADRPPGHGLLGMRERVGLYGGELHVGARDGHGYEVRARIPVDGTP